MYQVINVMCKAAKELEKIYDIRNGSSGKSHPKVSDGNKVNQLDIDVMTIQNYKMLAYMILELV